MTARKNSKNDTTKPVLEFDILKDELNTENVDLKKANKSAKKIDSKDGPPNLGKVVRLKTLDFNDPDRPKTCLEVDFPLAPINALSALEGNASKPIYQMSKWWARRRSSVFRATLIAAATEAPADDAEAAKKVWENYYVNHQKAGNFKNLKVLDNFMGGGTTLVEGARLGMQMYGVDLNPVAWLVVKNELSCSDPEEVAKLFDQIEAEVKPLILPYYTTNCPRGHDGRWVDSRTGETADVDPIDLQPGERVNYIWEGPEVIYTFWAKHGPCPAKGCNHRTPIFRSPVIAEKKLSTKYIEMACPECGLTFHAELGETRMAPDVPRVVLPDEIAFTEITQSLAQEFKNYSNGRVPEKLNRILVILDAVANEPGFYCPSCKKFAGQKLIAELERQRGGIKGYVSNEPVYDFKAANVNKKALGIDSKDVYMTLLINSEWLKGSPGSVNDMDLGGYAKAEIEKNEVWYNERLNNLEPVEVRGRIKLSEDDSSQNYSEGDEPEEDIDENISDEDVDNDETDNVKSDRKKYGLPRYVELPGGTVMDTRQGTVPGKSKFTCQNASCGRQNDLLTAVKMSLSLKDMSAALIDAGYNAGWVDQLNSSGKLALVRQAIIGGDKDNNEMILIAADENFKQVALDTIIDVRRTAPVAVYALQCHCPECEKEGYNYSGRYFKAPNEDDIRRLVMAEREWEERRNGDLSEYWPKEKLPYAWMTHHLNGGIPNWGYTHWWTMFNPRQLIIHSQVFKNLCSSEYNMSISEQCLGAFQQYLRSQNMFSFWNYSADKLEPMFSNANYHPKAQVIENSVFSVLGRGNLLSCMEGVAKGIVWCLKPWEKFLTAKGVSKNVLCGDTVDNKQSIICGTSSDLYKISENNIDLLITDPPFGDNLFYADLSDFFYIWLRIPMLKWYERKPEAEYWRPIATPKTLEAIRNRAEHPDDREEWEKKPTIKQEHLKTIRDILQDNTIDAGDPNPLYRPEPATEFYENTLTACWSEANRVLKQGGLLAFTFHHNDDRQWEAVLRSLFDAGFILVATYPIRSDETKGEGGQFGSRKIEYDILHVCRKRLEEPKPVSWAKMRRWVKEEVRNQQRILELYRNQDISEADIRVVLRGKALEFYSRHYGQVYTGSGEILSIRDALLGINQLLDDAGTLSGNRPPEQAQPITRLFLSLFHNSESLPRDDVHKMLRGTTVTIDDLQDLGWVEEVNRKIAAVPIRRRFAHLTRQGKQRSSIKIDLDLAHFIIGSALGGSGIDIQKELNEKLTPVPAVEYILGWYADTSFDFEIRQAAALGKRLLQSWKQNNLEKPEPHMQQLAFSFREEEEVYSL